jgi:hypothetical protein
MVVGRYNLRSKNLRGDSRSGLSVRSLRVAGMTAEPSTESWESLVAVY